MGQGSQSGMEGQHPAWSQMARMGGVASPLEMLQAQAGVQDARQQFKPIRKEFRKLPPGRKRRNMAPEFKAARDDMRDARSQYRTMQDGPQLPDPMDRAREHFLAAKEQRGPEFGMIRDWYRGLQDMTPGEAIGTAAMGPPRMNEGPQFPGMGQHDGTVQGLLGILQAQSANQTFGGGGDDAKKAGGADERTEVEKYRDSFAFSR